MKNILKMFNTDSISSKTSSSELLSDINDMKPQISILEQQMNEVRMEVVLLKAKDLEQEYVDKSSSSSSSLKSSFKDENDTSHAYHSNTQTKEESINVIKEFKFTSRVLIDSGANQNFIKV